MREIHLNFFNITCLFHNSKNLLNQSVIYLMSFKAVYTIVKNMLKEKLKKN